ncbi:bacteriohemerythrin [uncultured Treponema sp.]|uniref:bacteriohemerythrin n=1 Tax=uncultured Treponema sp. TaxID=162155 RepID=UPI0025E65EB2|nr:bacteriohemerythrin [uncultured Treponema sp.]
MKVIGRKDDDEFFIKWDPKYKIGIPVIDAQHEHLVKLCNDFYQSLLKNNDFENYQSLVKQTLEKCLSYASTHFKEEERLMLAAKFEGYKQHKASHDAFTQKCEINYGFIDKLPAAEAIKFAHFLYDWIHTHIAHEDRLYLPALVEFLKKNQSK